MIQDERTNQMSDAVEQVREVIAEHARICQEQVAAAEEAAQSDVERFGEASERLAQERQKLASLEEERGRLPFEAYRASLDGDSNREAELKDRYASLTPEDLETLRRRCGQLEAEIDSLGGSEPGAEKRAFSNALDSYRRTLESLGAFDEEIGALRTFLKTTRDKFWAGQRQVEEQLRLLQSLEQDNRREAQRETARQEATRREEARRTASGLSRKGVR